jgi:hypothetical protein
MKQNLANNCRVTFWAWTSFKANRNKKAEAKINFGGLAAPP